MTPMRWFWEHSHYRKITGDLVLDRVFGTSEPERPLPANFGVRLTGTNIDAHISRSRSRPPGLGGRQFRSGRTDHADGANLDDAQSPGRGDLLVTSGSFRALRGARTGAR